MLGLERTVVEAAEFAVDDAGEYLAVAVRPRKKAARRCGQCQTRAPWYDNGGGRRWWRGLDLGVLRVWLHADAPRVNCPVHARPWPRCRGPGTTRGSPPPSKTPQRGWPHTPARPRSRNCCGRRGGRCPESSAGLSPTVPVRSTGSPG
ncbi:transposase family protein [Micromonospora craniellae]|uniref:Transposase family protein n=1 Tax=Micromonospora craniellae TaxID=2294034 RepID=A0A372FY43_9ACTN|nr:transposase family protein [Micromonospora craniellae]